MDTGTILLVLFAVAMVAMHLRGHGHGSNGHGSGGHGCGGGHGNHETEPAERPATEPDGTAPLAGDHAQHGRHAHV